LITIDYVGAAQLFGYMEPFDGEVPIAVSTMVAVGKQVVETESWYRLPECF
jgi:hypothetical protein